MTEQNKILLDNIRYIMSVGSSSTQTYDIVTQKFIPKASSINVGSKNISGVVDLINESESEFKDEGNILCVNSIGYNKTLFPPQEIKNNDKMKGVCKLDGTDIKKITETGEATNISESTKDRVFVLNRNCGNFLRKYYNTSGELESNKIIKVFSGQWASIEDIATKLWDDCVTENNVKLPTSALNLGDNIGNYAICDIGGGSTTVYTLNKDKLEKNVNLTNNVKENVKTNLGENIKGFNDIIDDDNKVEMMKSYYKSVFDACIIDNESRHVIMIQTGKKREAFFKTNETLQEYIKNNMPKKDDKTVDNVDDDDENVDDAEAKDMNKTVNNVHFMFLPHELEGKYEAIDFCNKIAPNRKLINLRLTGSGDGKKIEISDSIIQTAKQDLKIEGGSRTKKMKNKSKKNSKRKTRKNPIKRLLKKLKNKKTKNKRSKKKKTSKK